jgi:probable HAF family extracellular repeat protein
MEGMHMKVLRWNARGATLPALALLAMLPYSTAVAQTSYTLTIITTTNSSANGINVNGDIVGQNVFSGGDTEAFLFKNGKVIELQIPPNPHAPGFAPPPTFPVAQSVNDSDVVVGSGSVGIGQNPRPFIWQPGQTVGTDIGVLANNCVSVKAQGVNNPGQIVGTGTQCLPNPNVGWFLAKGQTTPTLLPTLGGVSTAAFGVNDLGQVVGDSALDANAQTIHAFVWQLGTGIRDLGVLPGGTFSNAVAINKNGVAVGASTFNGGTAATGDRHAVVFQNGLVTDLDPNLPSWFRLRECHQRQRADRRRLRGPRLRLDERRRHRPQYADCAHHLPADRGNRYQRQGPNHWAWRGLGKPHHAGLPAHAAMTSTGRLRVYAPSRPSLSAEAGGWGRQGAVRNHDPRHGARI